MENQENSPSLPGRQQDSIAFHLPSGNDRGKLTESLEAFYSRKPDLCRLVPVTFQRQSTSRKVICKGDRDHHVGLFASRLNQALVPFESALEKDACCIFEGHPEIQAYRSQPYKVRLYYAGKTRTVFPDFELVTVRRKILVDIRHENNTQKPLFQERCDALAFYAEQRGMAYTLMTDQLIRSTRLINTRWLLSLIHGSPYPELIEIVWEWVLTLEVHTFGQLFDLTEVYPEVRCVLAGLALDGHLSMNLDEPLRDQLVYPHCKGRK